MFAGFAYQLELRKTLALNGRGFLFAPGMKGMRLALILFCALAGHLALAQGTVAQISDRLRLIVETDAGGDPDDEQPLVRFLLYLNEWDVEGIIANRQNARDGENRNSERTG